LGLHLTAPELGEVTKAEQGTADGHNRHSGSEHAVEQELRRDPRLGRRFQV